MERLSNVWQFTPAELSELNNALPVYWREQRRMGIYPSQEALQLQAAFARALGFEGGRHGPKVVRRPADMLGDPAVTMDSVQTVSSAIGLKDQTVTGMCRDSILAAVKVGKSWRIERSSWQEYARRKDRRG